MPSAVDFPPTFPAVDILPGDTILAEHWAPMANLANIALSYAGTGPLVQQSWLPGVLRYSGNELEDEDDIPIPMLRWRIPIVSDQHTTLDIEVIGEYIAGAGAGTGRVRLKSANTGDTLTLNFAEGGGAVTGTLTIGPAVDRAGVDRVDEIWLYPRATGGADHFCEVTRVRIECPALPLVGAGEDVGLADTRIDDVCPIGTGFAAADHPLSTPIGHWLLDVLEVLSTRPRVWANCSGIEPAYIEHLPEGAEHLVEPPARIGVLSTWQPIEGHGIVAHVRRTDDAGADRILDIIPELPPSETAQWVSHHERRDRASFPFDSAGVSGRAGGGVNSVSIWTREGVDSAAGPAWAAEDDL